MRKATQEMDSKQTKTFNPSPSDIIREWGEAKRSPTQTSLQPSGPLPEHGNPSGNTTRAVGSQENRSFPTSSEKAPRSSRASNDADTSVESAADSDAPEPEASSSCDTDTARSSNQFGRHEGDSGEKETESSDEGEKKTQRKGKWAVEEEEYTSRVIQHFSAGLLTLPDGATLRSYLAEKLNCDPMRITKKFTGACCLGRRVYHLRDRPRATPAELQMAKVERDHLEHRFRMRIEHEQSGLPISSPEMLLGQPQGHLGNLYSLQNYSTANTVSPWLNNLGAGLGRGGVPSFPPSGNNGLLSGAQAKLYPNIQQQQHNTPRWLLPGVSDNVATNSGPVDPSIQLLNNLVTSLVAQAAATISPGALASLAVGPGTVASVPLSSMRSHHQPAISTTERTPLPPNLELQMHLHRAQEEQRKEEEQRQLRAAFEDEKRKKEEIEKAAVAVAASSSSSTVDTSDSVAQVLAVKTKGTAEAISPAEQLQKSYEAHLQALKKAGQSMGEKPNCSPMLKTGTTHENGNEETMADEEAGTVLLGFLKSLRQSYEDAVDEKESEPLDQHLTNNKLEPKTGPTKSKMMRSLSTASKERAEKQRSCISAGVKRSQASISRSNSLQGSKVNGRDLSSTVSQFINSKVGRRSQRPASVTDMSSGNSSSQPAEFSSSLEDSSDKTDPSSSEESEKEDRAQIRRRSKGPPRKRLKSFTAENLIAHSKRMSEASGDRGREDGNANRNTNH